MGLFKNLFNSAEKLEPFDVDDNEIVAVADGKIVENSTITDEVFAQEMMGKTITFNYDKDKVTLCAPANGVLTVLFPTGHAFGITTNTGVELLVHCGVNTVNSKGEGFKLCSKKQGEAVKAGDPIVEVNLKLLKQTYDMSTMLIVTNPNDKEINFIAPQTVTRGQSLLQK